MNRCVNQKALWACVNRGARVRVYAHRHTQRAGLLFSRIYARRGHVEELFISVCARPCVHKYIPARARELSRGRQIQLSLEIHRHTRSIYIYISFFVYICIGNGKEVSVGIDRL